MSKSVGNVIDPHEMVNAYCSDTFRLYITGEVGVGQDLNFSDDRIRAMNNDFLADKYWNLVNRVCVLWITYRDKEITQAEKLELRTLKKYPDKIDITWSDNLQTKLNKISQHPEMRSQRNIDHHLDEEIWFSYISWMKKYNTQECLNSVRELLEYANNMLTEKEPWKKSWAEKEAILKAWLRYIYYTTLLLSPFIPEATGKVMKAMGIDPNTTLDTPMNIDLNTITKPEILFEKK